MKVISGDDIKAFSVTSLIGLIILLIIFIFNFNFTFIEYGSIIIKTLIVTVLIGLMIGFNLFWYTPKTDIAIARRNRRFNSALRLLAIHSSLGFVALFSAVPLILIVLTSVLPTENDLQMGNFVLGIQYLPQLVLDIPSILLAAVTGFDAFISGIVTPSFARVLSGADAQPFSTFLFNSLFIAVLSSIIALIISITAGYALSRLEFSGKSLTLGTMLLTQMFPLVILLMPYMRIFGASGLDLISSEFEFLGLKIAGAQLLLIIIYSGTAVPFMTWMIRGFFDSIDVDIEKAAIIDGCSRYDVITRITLPLAKPGIAATLMYSFLVGWNEVMFALTFLISKENRFTLPLGLLASQYTSENNTLFIPIAAYSLAVAVPAIIIFAITQRYMVSGLTAGATKR